MPSFLRFTAVSFALAALAGCSGARQQIEDEPLSDPTGSVSTSVDAGGAPSTGGGGTTGSSSGSGSGSGSSSGSGSGGGSGTGSGNGSGSSGGSIGSPAPANCPANGVVEDGTNTKHSSAITFTSAACGTVSGDGADWWRFELPGSATTIALDYSGKIEIQVTSQGDTVTLGSGGTNPPLPFHPGGDYLIEVTSASGSAEPYVLVMHDQ